jgi:hypothetical protein
MIGTTVVRWATYQTGFDSISQRVHGAIGAAGTTGMITAEAPPIAPQHHRRAQATCLEGCSYSVY